MDRHDENQSSDDAGEKDLDVVEFEDLRSRVVAERSKITERSNQTLELSASSHDSITVKLSGWSAEAEEIDKKVASKLSELVADVGKLRTWLFDLFRWAGYGLLIIGIVLLLISLAVSFQLVFIEAWSTLATLGVAALLADLFLYIAIRDTLQQKSEEIYDLSRPVLQGLAELRRETRNLKTNLADPLETMKRLPRVVNKLGEHLSTYTTFTQEYYQQRELHRKQQSFARLVRTALLNHHIIMDEKALHCLERFASDSPSDQVWLDEIASELAPILNMSQDILKIFFYDFMKDTSNLTRAFESLKSNDSNLLASFINVLLTRRLIELPVSYRESTTKVADSVENIVRNLPDFSVDNVRQRTRGFFWEVDNEKDAMLGALESLRFMIPNAVIKQFKAFPPHDSDLISALSAELAEEIRNSHFLDTEMDEIFIKLFYYKYINSPRHTYETFEGIKKSGKLLSLATLLLAKRAIVMESEKDLAIEARNLSTVMEFEDDFDVGHLQYLYNAYGQLHGLAIDMQRYFENESLIFGSIDLDFEEIVKLLSASKATKYLEQVKMLSDYLLKKGSILQIGDRDRAAAIAAIVCSFLAYQENLATPDACKEATILDLTLRILYRHMELKESEVFKAERKATLSRAIEEVLNDPSLSFRFQIDFKIGLSLGILYNSTKELLLAKSIDIEAQSQALLRLNADFGKIRDNVKRFLDAELPEEFLLYAIDAQLIQAYMISMTTHKHPIITDIVDVQMKAISRDMALQNTAYESLLLFAEDTKTIGGYSTRIGIVPIGLSFDQFAARFNDVFEAAVEKYFEEHRIEDSDVNRRAFSVNLFRFFASPMTFRKVRGVQLPQGQIDPAHPIHTVKKVIVDYLDSMEALKLVASSKPEKERKIILRRVIIDLFDSQADILFLVRSETNNILGKHPKLRTLMSDRTAFNMELFHQFNCNSFTKLAQSIHYFSTSQGGKVATINVRDNLKKLLSVHRIKLTDEELNQISMVLTRVLSNIGEVLEY